jgi:hypothetical protein
LITRRHILSLSALQNAFMVLMRWPVMYSAQRTSAVSSSDATATVQSMFKDAVHRRYGLLYARPTLFSI